MDDSIPITNSPPTTSTATALGSQRSLRAMYTSRGSGMSTSLFRLETKRDGVPRCVALYPNVAPRVLGRRARSRVNDGGTPVERADRRGAGVQPLARPAGGALDPPVHRAGLRHQRVQPAAQPGDRHHRVAAGGLEAHDARLDLHAGDRLS